MTTTPSQPAPDLPEPSTPAPAPQRPQIVRSTYRTSQIRQQPSNRPSALQEAYNRTRTPFYYGRDPMGPSHAAGGGLRLGPENYRITGDFLRNADVQRVLKARGVTTFQWQPGQNEIEDVAFSRPEQTFWQNPQRVARYHTMIRAMPPGWQAPDWMPTKEIEAAYQYLKFRNNDAAWQDWKALPDDDPGADFLRGLKQPPNEFLMPDEQHLAKVPSQAEIDAAKPFGDWDNLTPWEQVYESIFSPQPGMTDRPEWTRGTAAVGAGILAGLGGAAVGTAIGGPIGAAIGFLGVTGAAAYQAYTGQEIPVLGQVLTLFDLGAMEAERAIAYGQTAAADGWKGGWQELLANYPRYREATKWGYEAGLSPLGANRLNTLGPILSGAIDIAHQLGLSERAGGWTGPAREGEVWQLEQGLATPQRRQGLAGTEAMNEYVRRLEAGEDRAALDQEFSTRFGTSGMFDDFLSQSVIDPLNLAPFIEGRAGQGIAKLAGQERLAAAFKSATGNPLIDVLPMGVQQLASWLTGAKSSDGLLGAMQQYKSWIQRGYFPAGMTAVPASQLSRFDKYIGGLTSDGLIRELQPHSGRKGAAGWVEYLTTLTPSSKAHVMETAAHDNINVLLSMARQDPETMVRLVRQAAGVKPTAAGDLGEAVLNSPMTATISAALQEAVGDGFDMDMLNAWVSTEAQRTLLGTVSQKLGLTPGQLLEQLDTNPDVTAQRINQVAPTAGTPDQIKAMFKSFLGEDPAPWTPEMFQAQLALHLFDHMDEWLTKRFDLKPDHAVFRMSQTLKGMQSLLLLGLNPAYFINNAVNNAVTRGAVGAFGYMTPRQIDNFMQRFGITPERLRVGLDPSSDGKSTSLHQNAALHKGDWIDKVQGVVDATNEKMGLFSRFSAANERLEGANAYTIGMNRFWKKNWKEGVGFRKLDPLVESMLDRQAPGVKEAIYAAIRAGMNMDEVEARLLGDYIQPSLQGVVDEAARKVYPNSPELGAQVIQEIGILPELEKALAGAKTPEEVTAAFVRIEQRLQDFVDEAATRDLVHRAAEVRNQVTTETQVDGNGFAAALGIFTDLQVKIATRWLAHFGEWQDLYNRRDTMTREEFDLRVRSQMATDTQEWKRINTFELQTYAGIIQALGMESETSRQFISLLTESHENWRRFYDGWDETRPDGSTLHHPGRNEKYKQFFNGMKRKRGESEADYFKRYDAGWRKLQDELADDYRRSTAEENRLQRAMDERFAGSFEEHTKRPTPEALAWREQVQAIRMQMQEAMNEFRQRAVEMTPEERRAAWTEFIRGYNQLIVELKRTEIEGAWALSHQQGETAAAAVQQIEQAGGPVQGPQPAGPEDINAALAGSEGPTPSQQLQNNLAEALKAGITNRAGAPVEAYTLNIVNAYLRTAEGANEPRPPQTAQPTRTGLERAYSELSDVPTDLVARALAIHATPEAWQKAQAAARQVLDANDILHMADQAQREAAIHAAGMMARRHVREKLQSAFHARPEEVEAAMLLMDYHADRVARMNQQTPSDATRDAWYATHIANILDSSERGQLHQQQQTQAWYYSQLLRTAETMPPKMTADALAGFLKGKVKADELRWTGFEEWLDEKRAAGGQVTKQEVTEFLRANQVRVDEIIFGGDLNRRDLPGWAAAEMELTDRGWRIDYNDEDPEMIGFHRIEDEGDFYDFLTPDEVEGEAGALAFKLDIMNRAYVRGVSFAVDPNFMRWQSELKQYGIDVLTKLDDPQMMDGWTQAGQPEPRVLFSPDEETLSGDVWSNQEESYMLQQIPRPAQRLVESIRRFVNNYKEPVQNPVKYAQYTQPGGKGYRELLLRLDRSAADEAGARAQYQQEHGLLGDGWDSLNQERRRAEISDYRKRQGIPEYLSGHWGEQRDVLAHIRFDERTGPNGERVLYIQEIQSDWHEQGRKQGYANTDPALIAKVEQLEAQTARLFQEATEAKSQLRRLERTNRPRAEARRAALDAYARWEQSLADLRLAEGELSKGPPAAPFTNTWEELSIKRMIRWAAENGYDRVEWTTGEFQYQLWGSELFAWQRNEDGTFTLVGKEQHQGNAAGLDLEAMAEQQGYQNRNSRQIETIEDVERVVGDVMARKSHEYSKANFQAYVKRLAERIFERMENEPEGQLLPRREGMEAAYDRTIPNLAAKYIKKWGGKVDAGPLAGSGKPFEFTIQESREGYDIISPATRDVVDSFEFIDEAQDWVSKTQIRHEPGLYTVYSGDEIMAWNLSESDAKIEMEQYNDSRMEEQSQQGQPGSQVQGFNLTPAMREAALAGQPLFQRGSQIKPTTAGNLFYQRGMSTADIVARVEDAGWVDPATIAGVFENTAGPHLQEVARFITQQRQKYVEGRMTPRDVAKAYLLTVSSIGSDGKTIDTAVRTFLDAGIQFTRDGQPIDLGYYAYRHPSTGEWYIRPEELTAAWLMSDAGQRALADLELGKTDGFKQYIRARRKVYGRFEESFVETQPLGKGKLNLEDIDEITRLVNEAEGDPEAIGQVISRLAGISAGKTGFVKHLLGFGDETTLDIQEINFWTGRMIDEGDAQLIRDKWKNNPEITNAIKQRVQQTFTRLRDRYGLGADLPEEAFVHVMHHWLWDAQKQTQTTHQGMYRAMQYAQEAHASVEFLDNGRAIIRAINSPDISSIVHEIGHIFRRDLPPADLDTIAKWGGLADGAELQLLEQRFQLGDFKWREYTQLRELVRAGQADEAAAARFNELEQDAVVRDLKRYEAAEEKFARGWERYLAEGDAPTPELRSVFRRFTDWMLKIYSQLKRQFGKVVGFEQTLAFAGVELNQTINGTKIRDIFDRLLVDEARRPLSLEQLIADRLERIQKDRRYTTSSAREKQQLATTSALADVLRGDANAESARARASQLTDAGDVYRTLTGQEIDPVAIWDAARLAEENPEQAPWSRPSGMDPINESARLSARERAILHSPASRLPGPVQHAIRTTAQMMLEDIRHGGSVRIGEGEEGTLGREGNSTWYWAWYDAAGKPAGFKRSLRTVLEKIITGSEDTHRPLVRQTKATILGWLSGEVPSDLGPIPDPAVLWYLGRKEQLFRTFEQQLDTATPEWLEQAFGAEAEQVIGEYIQFLDQPPVFEPGAPGMAEPSLLTRMGEASQAEANAAGTFETGAPVALGLIEGMRLEPGDELPRPTGAEEAATRGLGELAAEYAGDLIDWVENGELGPEPTPPAGLPPRTVDQARAKVQAQAGRLREYARSRKGAPIGQEQPGPGLQVKRARAFRHGEETIAALVYQDGTLVAYLPENAEAVKRFGDDGARLLGLDPEDPSSWVVLRGEELLRVNPDEPTLPAMPKAQELAPRTEDAGGQAPQLANAVELYGEGSEISRLSPRHKAQMSPPWRGELYQRASEHQWITKARSQYPVDRKLTEGSMFITPEGDVIHLPGEHETAVNALTDGAERQIEGFIRTTKTIRAGLLREGAYFELGRRPTQEQIRFILDNLKNRAVSIDIVNERNQIIDMIHIYPDDPGKRSTVEAFLQRHIEGGRLYQGRAEHEWVTKAKATLRPTTRITSGNGGWITPDGMALAFTRESKSRPGSPFTTHYDTTEDITGEFDSFDEFVEATHMIRVDTAPNEVVFEIFHRPTRDQIRAILEQAKRRAVHIDLTHPGDITPFDSCEVWGDDQETIVEFLTERGRLYQPVSEMTPEQMRQALLHDEMTGLRNRRAYEEDERLPYQLVADVEGLKFVNDNYGHPAGDQVIRAAANALREAAGEEHAYRGSDRGDEYIAQFRTLEEAQAAGRQLEQLMDQQQIEINSQAHQGLGISYGIGKTMEEADLALNAGKTVAQQEGRRANRGEKPRNLRPVGQLNQQNELPAQAPAPAAPPPAAKPKSTYTPMINVSNLESVPSPLSGYVGNKRSMLQAGHYNEILSLDRAGNFKRVVECFGGSGLLGNAFQRQLKTPRVYNELDPNVVAFHRQVKERPAEVIAAIQAEADQVIQVMTAYPEGGADAYDAIQNFWKGMQFRLARGSDVEKAALMAINNSGGLSIMGGGSQKIISGASVKEGSFVWRAGKESFATVIDQIRRHGELLKAVQIHEGDARQRLAEATPSDLVLLDPPYVSRGIDDNRVTGYAAGEDLLTLEGALTFIDRDMAEAQKRGIPMVYTNNAHPVLIEALRENGFHIRLVSVRSQNARGATGGATYRDEVVAWNDPVGPADAGWRGTNTEEVLRRVGSGRADYLSYRARAKRLAAQHGAAQDVAAPAGGEGTAPIGGTPIAEPFGDAIDELNTENVRPLLRQVREDYQAQLRGSRLKGVKGLDPAGQAEVGKYLKRVESDMASTKYAAMSYGEQLRDASLLNYNRRYGFDNYLGLAMPYQFWYTRSMMNWAKRMIDRPAWFGMYARLQQMQEKQARNMPTRLKGKSRIPAPWLPDWAGGGIWTDPWAKIFPFKQFGQPLEQLASDKNMIERRAESILRDMVEAETISESERASALASKTGEAWQQAVAQAQVELDKDASPASIVTNMVQPALWWTALDAMASGKPEKISPLPITRTAQALRTATTGTPLEGVGRIGGLLAAPEEALRRQAGLSQFGEWGDYTIDRTLANMAADGTTSAQEAKRAMIERNPQDPIYAEAIRRVEYEQMLRTPGAATLNQLASGNLAGTVQSLPTLLFPGGLFPEGELAQRGLKPEYDAAWKRYKNGDDKAMQKFFDDYPEYEARLALYDEPGDRLQQFMVSEIWDRYYKLSRPNQQKARELLGQQFEDSFMNKETRAYDAIPVEQLAMWSRMLNGMVPRTDQTAAVADLPEQMIPQPDYWSPEVSAGIEAYQNERRQSFPNYYAVQEQYYNLPKGAARRSFLKRFPELKQYWDWKAAYKQQHPELAPYFEQASGVDEQGVSPQEISAVSAPLSRAMLAYLLGGSQLTSGAKAELLRLSNQAGRSITPEEYARLLMAGMVAPQ